MNLNNKGFTLVEILAVVVILGVLMAFMYPNVTRLINKNKAESLEQLKLLIESAAKIYISDYRYNISVNGNNITKINNRSITNNKVLVSYLIEEGALKVTDKGNIHNPQNTNDCLNTDSSYIEVKYNSTLKDFEYGNISLTWGETCK